MDTLTADSSDFLEENPPQDILDSLGQLVIGSLEEPHDSSTPGNEVD